jgi:ketosteroid isomerase-like protein
MADPAAAAERLIQAYNRKDFDALEAMIAPDLDFAHYNRDFVLSSRGALLDVLRNFASAYIPDRHFEPVERVTTSGNIVVREGWYGGTPAVDLPGFGAAGERFRLKFCSVMRFDDNDILVEWKDHG